jgi:DNA-directed RNA polymerase specialized sigma24 family protein
MRRKKLSTSYSPENRGHSRQDAQDLTQDFFVHMLEKGTISRADSQRGRFRNFLLGALEHFLANAGERACAIKRGGSCKWIFFFAFFL